MNGGSSWVQDASLLIGQVAALLVAVGALIRLFKGNGKNKGSSSDDDHDGPAAA